MVESLDCIVPKKNILSGLELSEDDKVWRVVRTRVVDKEKLF